MQSSKILNLALSFESGVLGVTVWYFLGIVVFSDLYTMQITYMNILTHYAIPIQIVATIFFYVELFVMKKLGFSRIAL